MNQELDIVEVIHNNKLITIQEHDTILEDMIASGNAIEEPEPIKGQTIYTGIGCNVCAFELFDFRETKTDKENKKYRHCYCFSCGKQYWRRTP